jgi:MOSC domain-containing protein YiiM
VNGLDRTETEIHPAQKLSARVEGVFAALGENFVTQQVEALELTFEGIVGDIHAGHTRRSGGREPWYPRGTEMANERQLSIVSDEELARIAGLMEVPLVRPEWIGANLLISGVPALSMVPPRSQFFFENGVTIRIDGQNAPCRVAGRSLARHAAPADPSAAELRFPAVAKRLRGLVAWVEKPGRILPGERVSIRVPEQWIYRPGS